MKLVLVFAMGLCIALPLPLYLEALNIFLFACLFFFNGQRRASLNLSILFAILAGISYTPHGLHPVLDKMLVPTAYMVRRFMLPIVAGKYLIDSTPVSLMMSALEKLKMPQSVVITVAVMFRFYPTLGEEWKNIKNAMKMRGIGVSFVNVVTRPLVTLEYVMVPLLASASRIADELSCAGHTKGVDSPYKKNRYKQVAFSLADLVIFLYIVACFALIVVLRIDMLR